MDKDIFAIIGELYYNLVIQKRTITEKEIEIKTKEAVIKDMKDKLDANIRQRGAIANSKP